MSVSKMKRLTAIVGAGESEELAKRLVWLSCVDLDISPMIDGGDAGLAVVDTAERRKKIEMRIDDASTAIDLLSQHDKTKKKLLAPKPELERGGVPDERVDEARSVTEYACAIGERTESVRRERARVAAETEAILPWREYDVPLAFAGTECTDVMIGSLPSGNAQELPRLSEEFAADIIFENDVDGVVYIAVIAHKSDSSGVSRFLSALGFVRSPAETYDSAADALLAERRETLIALDEELQKLDSDADQLAVSLPDVKLYSDAERTNLTYTDAVSRMSETERTRCLTGWVPEAAEAEVTAELEALGCAYELSDPKEDDDVPVKLVNNKFAESFEPVVELYSLPKYGTYDPTFVMSIFYIVLFGMMFADFGYGLVVSAACLLGLKLMKPRGTMNKFLRMFAICGVSSMFFGILLGGYFGDLPSKISSGFFGGEEFSLAIWFDPINDPMTFLVASIAVGAIHLIGALGVKFYILCKTKTVWDAIFDAGSWILVFLGGGSLAIGMMAGVGALTPVGIVLLILGYGILIATQGRAEKSIVMKIGKGLMSLYDTISYVSDLLSYSRVLSLGLASAVIGSVFNLLGTIAGFNFFGIIIFVIAVLLGHTLNIAINLLGTFVHTSRLQYIEFFGKFYESGGRAFVPLEPKTKYYVYKQKEKIKAA